jgi:transcription initiation factor TFIIIB Brf1 subunit/transcription initiation factor TFIIB
MDYCHCAEPAPETVNGNVICLNCRWLYEEQLYNRDSRVQHAKQEARRFTKEQQDIVDTIMRESDTQD